MRVKIFTNKTRPLTALSFKQTFYWADVNNKNSTDLNKFAEAFLNRGFLGKMISNYVVLNE